MKNAKFFSDHWHLFESSSLQKSFGHRYYEIIKGDLRQMALSNNENSFDSYLQSAREKLMISSNNNGQIYSKIQNTIP